MADLRYRVVVDDQEARRRLRELLANTGVSSQGSGGAGADDAKKAAAGIENVRRAQVSLKDAQEAAINSLRKLREERSKELSELNTLKQLEQEAKALLAEKKTATESLNQAQKEANVELTKARKESAEYNKQLREQAEERRKAAEEEKKAEKVLRDAEKARRDAEKEAQQNAKNKARRQKDLQKESSEYYQLNQALGNVRAETKDLLAEMFKMERQGRKNTVGYEILRQKAEALTKQTQYLDSGIKKIDATLGLHQRNVGNYGDALNEISPIISDINRKLALFGTSIDQLAGKPGAIKELGAAFVTMGKGILTFLLSPVGMAIIAIGGLFKLFQANKQTVIDFDDGLLNVSKTTGLIGSDLAALSDDIIKLSRSLKTVDTSKLLEYATVAGQLGVKGRENILAFAEALAKLETASDISGEEGGAQIARLLTLVDGGVQNVKAFGDEIVNLGNNFPATEAEILANATRIAQSTGVYKLGRQEVLAYATATKSVGVEAELVGSTIGRTLGILEKVIRTGKGVDTVLKLVGGTQAQLRARFAADSGGVLTDFVGALNKIDRSGGSVNGTLSKIGISAQRDRAVIGSLATNGYNVLLSSMEKVKDAAGAMDEEFTTAAGKLVNQTARIGIAWDNLVLSIENGQGVIGKSSVAVVGFFADVIEAITPAGSATKQLTEAYIAQRTEVAANEAKMRPLLERYDEFRHSGHLNTKEQKELHAIIQQIASAMPSAVTQWNSLGEALDINRSKVLDLTEAHRELLREMNLSTARELNKQFEDQAGMADRALKILNNNNFNEIGLERQRERFAKVKNELLETAKDLQSIGVALSGEQRDVLERYGFLNTTALDVAMPDRFKKGTKVIDDEVDEAALKKAEDAAKRAAEQRRQASERQRALQLSIDSLNEQASRNAISRDQQEVASIKDKYAKIKDEVAKFYRNPKNKGFKVDMGGLQASEDFEVSEANYRIDTKNLEKELAIQLQLYKDFESHRETFGLESAENRYKKELGLIKGYKDRLNAELLTLEGNDLTASLFGSGTPKQLTQAQQERLKYVQETLKAIKREEEKSQSDLLATLISYDTKRKLLIEKYETDRKLIVDKVSKEELAEQDRKHQEELDQLDGANIKKLQSYKDLYGGIERLTDAGARSVLKNARLELLAITNISPELRKEIEQTIKDTEESLSDRMPDRLNYLSQGFASMAQGAREVNEELGGMLQGVSNVLSAVVQIDNGFKNLKIGLKNYKDQKSDGGGGILSSISAIAGVAGPVGQIAGAVANVAGGVIRFFKASKESARQAADQIRQYQESVLSGESEYNRLLRERAREQKNINDLTSDQILLQQALLKSQSNDSQKEFNEMLKRIQREGQQITGQRAEKHGGFLGIGKKTRVIDVTSGLAGYSYEELERLYTSNKLTEATRKQFEELQKLKDEVDNIAELWDAAQMELVNRMSGGATSDSITKSIIDGFKNGKRAVADFADDMESVIENALISAMAFTYLEEPIKKLVEDFQKNSLDGLDEDEIKQFEEGYKQIIETGTQQVEAIERALGRSVGGSKKASGSISNEIKGITENTANRLEAEFGGLRLAQLELLNTTKANHVDYLRIAQDHLVSLNQIQLNTYRTANNTDNLSQLSDIRSAIVELNKKVTNGDMLRRGAGL